MIGFHPYRQKRSPALPIVIILVAVVISFSAWKGLFGIRSFVQAVLFPFQSAAVSTWKGIVGIPSSLASARKASEENAKLRKELDSLQPQLIFTEELLKENSRLRSLLAIRDRNPYRLRLLPAQIIGRAPDPWFSILQIDQGKEAGVKMDMAVMVAEGLVGRVVEVSRYSSKVMLLTDAESSVAAVDGRSRDFGVVKGAPPGRLTMKHVDARGDVKVGDIIVTSNISAIFPPGLPLGEVTDASRKEHDLFYHIEIKPAVDFSKIEEVFLIL